MGAKSGGEAAAAGVAAPQPAVPAPSPAGPGSPGALEPAAYKLEDLETLATVGECGKEGNKGAAEVPVCDRARREEVPEQPATPFPSALFFVFFLSAPPPRSAPFSPAAPPLAGVRAAGVPAAAVGACGRLARTRRSLRAVRSRAAGSGHCMAPAAAVAPAPAAGSAAQRAWTRTQLWLVSEMNTVTAEAERPFGIKPGLSGLTSFTCIVIKNSSFKLVVGPGKR